MGINPKTLSTGVIPHIIVACSTVVELAASVVNDNLLISQRNTRSKNKLVKMYPYIVIRQSTTRIISNKFRVIKKRPKLLCMKILSQTMESLSLAEILFIPYSETNDSFMYRVFNHKSTMQIHFLTYVL